MKVAILGYAREGRTAFTYYSLRGADITIHDQDEELAGVPADTPTVLGSSYLSGLSGYDVIVRTAFLHPAKIAVANPDTPNILDKVTSATNLFLQNITTPVIGVTGTKGKGTVSLLAKAMLEAAGFRVALGGNIGISPLDMIDEAEKADYVVLEVSSFQAIDLKYSPSIGVCLGITPEHLDWHADYAEYAAAKAQMFANQASSDTAIYFTDNADSRKAVSGSPATKLLSYSATDQSASAHIRGDQIYCLDDTIAKVSDIKLLGAHNQHNVCAAVAAVWPLIKPNATAIANALQASESFPMRLQTVRKLNNISYINDSFGSAPEASIAAVNSVKEPKILIVGGHNKQTNLKPFAAAIAVSGVKHLVAIGDTGPLIANMVQELNPNITKTTGLTTMDQMVADATAHAIRGDAVLLSTGSASFGLFANYEDRGKKFNAAVARLA